MEHPEQPPVPNPGRCDCGRPTHYPTPEMRAQTEAIMGNMGYWKAVRFADGTGVWVPRPYLVAHLWDHRRGRMLAGVDLVAEALRHGWPRRVDLPSTLGRLVLP